MSHRGDERFAFASTYKALAAGLLLRRDTDAQLSSVVRHEPADLVGCSPVTSEHVVTGMTLRDLCAAVVDHSDTTSTTSRSCVVSVTSRARAHTAALADRLAGFEAQRQVALSTDVDAAPHG